MNKFVILFALVAAVVAEAPGGYSSGGAVTASRGFGGFSSGGGGSGLNEYVDQQLLDRVAAVISSNGDGTAQSQDNEGSQYVDQEILTRVASSLGDSGSSSRGVSSGYGAPAPGGQASLGNPEPAMQIAQWDLSETRSAGTGGYQAQAPQQGYGSPAPAAPQAPQQGYGAPAQRSSGGAISLGQPETAQRVAEWDATSQQQQGGRSSGGYSQGQQGGY